MPLGVKTVVLVAPIKNIRKLLAIKIKLWGILRPGIAIRLNFAALSIIRVLTYKKITLNYLIFA